MRLVDDHAAETVIPQPAHVPVENLVVDDDDVGEPVDGVTVAVDDRRGPTRSPQLRLVRPIGLDDVRDDDQEWKRVRGIRGEQRLRGLAQARFIREEERAMAGRGRSDDLGLVVHEFQPTDPVEHIRRLGKPHTAGVPAVLEGAKKGRQ